MSRPSDQLNAAQRLGLYRTMLRIRRFEERAARLFADNRLPGFVHLSIGEEATAAGACAALRPSDCITSTHRGHGHCIGKGGDLRLMMAELFGRRDGYCRGQSGSMHLADPDKGILGANGIVAGGLAMAIGAAYSAQVLGTGGVALAFFGDGAVAEGLFHESLNLAALWALPVIFLCENNLYAEMMPIHRHLKQTTVASYANSYGIPGHAVDGNDVMTVYDAVDAAVERARAGHGPTLLECMTYRWHGHYEGDPLKYRDPGELTRWQERDPLLLYAAALGADGLADQVNAIAAEVDAEVEDAVQFAEASPIPDETMLLEFVYSTPVTSDRRGNHDQP